MIRFITTLAVAGLMIMQAHAQQTITLQPGPEDGIDALISSYYPDRNFGDYTNYFALGWTGGGIPFISRALFKFDLSSIPSGAQVQEARLSMYYASNPANPNLYQYGDNETFLETVIEPWEEGAVTWLTQPATLAYNRVRLPISINQYQNYEGIDVTFAIQGMVDSPESNYGFMMRLRTEEIYRSMCFASSDYSIEWMRPKLVITYIACDHPVCNFEYEVAEDKVIFQDNSTSANSWWWDFGDGFFSNLQDPEHYYDHFGAYYVCLTVEDSCGTDTWCDSVQFCMGPDALYTYSVDGRKVEFHDSSLLADNYSWSFGNGFYSDLQNPEYTFEEDGVYEVCLTVSNSCGQSTLCDTLIVESSGLGDANLPLFKIYPNPAIDRVNIQISSHGDYRISLFHSMGKEILKETRTAGPGELLTLDVSRFSPGIYLLVIEYGGERFSTKLIIGR